MIQGSDLQDLSPPSDSTTSSVTEICPPGRGNSVNLQSQMKLILVRFKTRQKVLKVVKADIIADRHNGRFGSNQTEGMMIGHL